MNKFLGSIVLASALFSEGCASTDSARAKYVFLFIGDGMGSAQVALAEAYDADLANRSRRLQALSVRNQVGVAADSLMAGFVILGNGPMPVLVRGVGPGLVPAVSRAVVLQDPQLVLRRYLKDRWETVAANDN